MPTVVLIDRSLSMRRPASREISEHTRHSLACKGLEWFFGYLGECFPMEYTCLLSFSSTCDVMVPFTRNYAQLREKLDEVSMQDRTDIHNALVSMVEVMVGEWGAFAPCQAVLVTDGFPGVRHQDSAHRKLTLTLPFPCQLYVVCVSTREELAQPLWSTKLQRLCETTGVTLAEVFVPSAPLNAETVQDVFKQMARLNFKPFSGVLKCGHLQSAISLSPPPHVYKSKFDIVITSERKYPKLDERFSNLQYPHELAVCGFLDTSSISAPPLYARHFVLDPEIDDRNLESRLLSPGRGPSGQEKKRISESVDESQKPSFRVLLHGSLKCESKAALIKLSDHWFGLLFSQTSPSKKSNLVLTIFYPDSEIPWLGLLSYLGPKPTHTDPRITSTSEKDPFPVHPPRPPSFQNPNILLWGSEAVLQTDVTKVVRYSRKLPEKETSLVKELNKLRLVALTYSMPELTEMLCSILSKEEASSGNAQSKTLLQQCILFLSNNKNPQERLVVTPHK